jgi:4-hydroxythreonine-4-phosphate dehydrogenase
MGDPAGIGLDITLAAWTNRAALELPAFVLYGDLSAVQMRARQLALDVPAVAVENIANATSLFASTLPVQSIPLSTPVVPGSPDTAHAGAVIAAIEAAVADVVAGRADAVVTNPIAKASLYAAGFQHSGHTEFLAELARRWVPGGSWIPVMMLASDTLRVVPATVHVPLSAVPQKLTQELLMTTARITHDALRRDFGIPSPRLVVTGLNPHAGEEGTIGREEVDIIAPAVAALQAEGMDIRGPFSADSMFHAAARARYDAAIAMYHDQALIPLKTLAFDSGVNVTLGLPFVRTSPDHGTAFDIAGTGRASPVSLIAALKLAAAMAQRRAELHA